MLLVLVYDVFIMRRTRSWLIGAVFAVALVIFSSFLALGAAPVAVDDSVTMDEDTSVLVDVLANDSDPDGDPLTIDSVTEPEHGTVTIEGDKVRYTPDKDYYGTDSFSYTATDGVDTATATVTVTVILINDAPVAVDDVVSTLQETLASFALRATDVDVDPSAPLKHPLVFEIISGPAHGEISGDLTEVSYELPHAGYVDMTYSPEPGFTGNDTITFSVTDPFGLYDTAVIEIMVGRREMGALVGTWDSSIIMEGEPFEITALSSSLMGIYRLGGVRGAGERHLERQLVLLFVP